MFANVTSRFCRYVLFAAVPFAPPALAEDVLPSPPAVALPALPASTSMSGAAAVPPPDAMVPEEGQLPGVLREIGRRQTELTILELDLKRAELQKKLRELETMGQARPPQFLPTAAMPQNTGGGGAVPLPPDVGLDPEIGPQVRRIHKVGGALVAVIALPGGEIRHIRPGGLIGDLRVVQILPDTVYVRKGDQPPYALPVSPSRHVRS